MVTNCLDGLVLNVEAWVALSVLAGFCERVGRARLGEILFSAIAWSYGVLISYGVLNLSADEHYFLIASHRGHSVRGVAPVAAGVVWYARI